ncbi:MAG: two-component system, cell cycle sensor histidine kinase and response regulator CckA [Verrucomicrobiota bacterium]
MRMISFSSLRVRLVGAVLLFITPAWILIYLTHTPWVGFALGLLALAAAWFGGEHFILRQVRTLSDAAERLAGGDLSSRCGLTNEKGELGQLARNFDIMAEALEQRVNERERIETILLNHSLRQTVVAALGQFAMVSKDFDGLLDQVVMLTAQTLELEFSNVLELLPDGQTMLLRAGVGWKDGAVGQATVPADPTTQPGFTLTAGEPVVVENLPGETRFRVSPFLIEHGVKSGITVAISGNGRAFGILGAHTAQSRKFTEDEIHFLLSVATLLAMAIERNRAEAELQQLAAFAQINPNPAMELAADATVTYFNESALRLALSLGQNNPRGILPPEIDQIVETCLTTGKSLLHVLTKMSERTLSWAFHPVPSNQVVHTYGEDTTDRLNLEAQLRQSQKMESVGRLAAGVAHDFNNMLTIIQGHSGILLARPGVPQAMLDSMQAIFFASERAASLTRQLLMFSRKNVIQLKPLDLRDTVATMGKMLNRLLGENVSLQFNPPPHLPLIEADASMLEQVIMNLAVNARDAMPKGGSLIISTNAVEISESYVQTHPEARVGPFVCLRVSDAGCGMETAIMSRIFEPFFTTKEIGKGTGLGLATVYGIVKQHSGWIEVTSEVGHGSTFNILLPASPQKP